VPFEARANAGFVVVGATWQHSAMTVAAPAFSPAVDAPVCVALSGGMDSVALLAALAGDATIAARGLRALHVHHGLHTDADAWAASCVDVCAALHVELSIERIDVHNAGLGLEGAAREARHAAFARRLHPGEHLALAHHRDDQAETFLMRALRGSGVDGLGAMAPLRALGAGVAWRPWLDVPRTAIEAFARSRSLRWMDDPSNADVAFDRNFLRHRVLPMIRERWPHADAALGASAAHSREASGLLAADDHRALADCRLGGAHVVSLAPLAALPRWRPARVLRAWVVSLGLPPLPGQALRCIETTLLHARGDAQPRVEWSGAVLRAWRDRLHACASQAVIDTAFDIGWTGAAPLPLPDGASLAFTRPVDLPPTLRVCTRSGGERIRLPGRDHSHALKHVLQGLHVPPWTREHLPLLVDRDEVLAAGDLAISARLSALLRTAGAQLVWTRPRGA